MSRTAAINFARVGAQKLWAGTVTISPNAKTGAHHHGHLESVIYVLKGKARMRWGERLEFVAEAGPGDFIFVPPYVPHQEINAESDVALECVSWCFFLFMFWEEGWLSRWCEERPWEENWELAVLNGTRQGRKGCRCFLIGWLIDWLILSRY
jgi:hypothetical protein